MPPKEVSNHAMHRLSEKKKTLLMLSNKNDNNSNEDNGKNTLSIGVWDYGLFGSSRSSTS